MKYIRAKDGIFTKCKLNGYGDYWVLSHNTNSTKLKDLKVIKKANTIEELCDGFIITSKQGHIYDSYGDYDYELKEVLPQAREEYPDEDWDLYGCVLVNGIIKQVAKMNDKGKLELL